MRSSILDQEFAQPLAQALVRISGLTFLLLTQADKLQTLIKAAGIADVEPIWTSLFAKVHTSSSQ